MVHVAREMERQGFKLPLLIGGATTSRAHTAIKIAPHYSEPVVHVLDASRAVPVTTSLLSEDGKHGIRRAASRRVRSAAQELCRAQAEDRPALRSRAQRRTPIEWRAEDLASARHSPACACWTSFRWPQLREFIDWTPFFHTWELKGVYPRIFDHPEQGEQARLIFAEANALLDTIIEKNLLTARGVYGFFPANAWATMWSFTRTNARQEMLSRFHFLRQQSNREGSEPCRSLADFIAPKETGLRDSHRSIRGDQRHRPQGTGRQFPRQARRLQRHHGGGALPTGWPRPLPSACTSACARSGATAAAKRLTNDELIHEKYRGIRPAPGYPACPDHTEKGTLWRLLDVEANTGIRITESFAMWPGSSVSGLYFAHPRVALLQSWAKSIATRWPTTPRARE